MNQSSCFQNNLVDLSNAPWTMHEFFAGSGLVAYGLKGMFKPIWANDISEQKAAVYKENFGDGYFKLDDIKNIDGKNLPFANLSWASFPCQDLSLAGSLGGIHASRSGLVWEWLRVLDEMPNKPKIYRFKRFPFCSAVKTEGFCHSGSKGMRDPGRNSSE